MPNYRRSYVSGGTYFFTVKTLGNDPILLLEPYRTALRNAINSVRRTMPFQSIAWVLLPDHLHTIWQLPENDANYSLRWSLIKQEVTRRCGGLSSGPSTNRSGNEAKEAFGNGDFGSTQFAMILISEITSTTFISIR